MLLINQCKCSDSRKIRIPMFADNTQKIAVQSKSLSQEQLFQLRAAMSRIMKINRVLPLEKLSSITISELKSRFLPSSDDIRVSISYLIENEFIRRLSSGEFEYIP